MQDNPVFQNKIILPQHLQSRLLPVQQKIVRVFNTDGLGEICAKFGYSEEEAISAVHRIRCKIEELGSAVPIDDPEQKNVRRFADDFPKVDVPRTKNGKTNKKASIARIVAKASVISGIPADSLLAFKFSSEEVKTVARTAIYSAFIYFKIPKENIAGHLWCQKDDVTFALHDISARLAKKDEEVLELLQEIKSAFATV